MYNVGQVDFLKNGVVYPNYTVGSLTEDDYPCKMGYLDLNKRPVGIPLGAYNKEGTAYDDMGYAEDYTKDIQQVRAHEISDLTMLISMGILLILLIVCTYLSFKHKL